MTRKLSPSDDTFLLHQFPTTWILVQLLDAPLTRKELVEISGLHYATITNAVGSLVDRRFVWAPRGVPLWLSVKGKREAKRRLRAYRRRELDALEPICRNGVPRTRLPRGTVPIMVYEHLKAAGPQMVRECAKKLSVSRYRVANAMGHLLRNGTVWSADDFRPKLYGVIEI